MSIKVGMLTCFINNYGACLQAYALQTVLHEYTDQVDIIQYLEPLGYDNDNSLVHRLLFNPITKTIVAQISRKYRISLKFKRSCEEFKRKNLHFGNEKYYSYEQLRDSVFDYDVFVCGSDQIWNPSFYDGPNKAYYLDFVKKGRKVAYAPSIGVSDIEEKYRTEFVRLINRIDFVSVREQTGSKIIEKYCNREAKVVLDPTLLISAEDWKSKIEEEGSIAKERYIFCYLFGNNPFYFRFIEQTSKKMGLPVYIVPFSREQMRADYNQIYDAGPLGFVKLIHNASLVITDSFHATAFSINLNTPFYTLLRDNKNKVNSMNSRVIDILSMAELENRLWEEERDFMDFTTEVDWNKSNMILCAKRREDIQYLKQAIGVNTPT